MIKIAFTFLLSFILFVTFLFSCTTVCLITEDGPIFGKNYDWTIAFGRIFVNKKNVSKVSMLPAEQNPAKWISRYGNLTFNQYGREFPSGGMNEAGLVIELMWLNDTKYPPNDSKPHLGVLEWIQYQLDLSGSIEEVLGNSSKVAISSDTPLHYLVCDRTGNCTTVEYLDGRLIAHSGSSLPVRVLTNDTYSQSLQFLKQHSGFGGALPIPNGTSSLDRFARAAELNKEFRGGSGKDPVHYAFQILDRVAQPQFTQWSIVYDLKNRVVHYRTAVSRKIKFVDFNRLDFSCATAVRVEDMNEDAEGDRTDSLSPYTFQDNLRLITESYHGTEFLRDVDSKQLERTAKHPETMKCKGQVENH